MNKCKFWNLLAMMAMGVGCVRPVRGAMTLDDMLKSEPAKECAEEFGEEFTEQTVAEALEHTAFYVLVPMYKEDLKYASFIAKGLFNNYKICSRYNIKFRVCCMVVSDEKFGESGDSDLDRQSKLEAVRDDIMYAFEKIDQNYEKWCYICRGCKKVYNKATAYWEMCRYVKVKEGAYYRQFGCMYEGDQECNDYLKKYEVFKSVFSSFPLNLPKTSSKKPEKPVHVYFMFLNGKDSLGPWYALPMLAYATKSGAGRVRADGQIVHETMIDCINFADSVQIDTPMQFAGTDTWDSSLVEGHFYTEVSNNLFHELRGPEKTTPRWVKGLALIKSGLKVDPNNSNGLLSVSCNACGRVFNYKQNSVWFMRQMSTRSCPMAIYHGGFLAYDQLFPMVDGKYDYKVHDNVFEWLNGVVQNDCYLHMDCPQYLLLESCEGGKASAQGCK